MVKQLASWNSQSQVWGLMEANLFSERWVLWQEVWPKSGMTVNGSLFELPMPAHHTAENESLSSQLPTPKARDHQAEGYEAGLRRATPQVGTVVKALVDGDERLLPTPTLGHIRNHDEPVEDYLQRRQDFVDGKTKGMPGASLGVAVRMETLPTPKALDGVKGNLKTSQERLDSGRQVDLPNVAIDLIGTPRATASESSASQVAAGATKGRIEDQVLTTNWGKFEPAIRRWEALTRPAPAPTNPDGKDGNHRLSSKFTEWMMGLPDGWVTGHGLKRNDELKMCGNGVVPHQAELALRFLLGQADIPKA